MQQTRFADLRCSILNNGGLVQDIAEPIGIIVAIIMVHIIGIRDILKFKIRQLHQKYKYLFPTNDGHGLFVLITLGPEHLGQHTLTIAL